MSRRHTSTKRRIKAVTEIVAAEYQPGDQNKCYKAIWRRYIYPKFGVCYNTFLSYIGVPPSELEEEPEPEDPNQLKLFDL